MFTKEQFTHLAQKYMDMIYRIAFSYTKSRADAEDVTQNVLLSLYKSGKEFRDGEHVKAWLIRVTVNECKKLFRSPWRRAENLDDYANEMPFESPEYMDLFKAIMDLDVRYRTVIVLYYYEGYAIAEIAKLLDIPPATVGTRLARARAQLKKSLSEAYNYG